MNKYLKKLFVVVMIAHSFILLSQETFILNYEEVDIRRVTQDIANFSKKTIILDPRVKGKVTIFSNSSLTSDEVWEVYLRTIQVNGFSAISSDNFIRIVPENESTRDTSYKTEYEGDFVTKVIQLNNRSSIEILPALKRHLLEDRQTYQAWLSINSILIVDRKSNVARIEELTKALDQDNTAKVSVISLENLSSVEAVRILDKLKAQNNPTINNFIAIPFTSSNSVIISANKVTTSIIRETLSQAPDQDAVNEGSIAVIYLKYTAKA